jgi:hypothetical protein
MVSPSWRRKAVQHLVRHFHVSVRRACRVLGQHRSTQTYEAVPADYQLRLVKRMNELAAAHPKYGYRIVANLLQAEGWKVNKKRVARLWRLERNQVPPKRKSHTTTRARGVSGTQIRRDDQLAVPDVARPKGGPMVVGPDSQAALGKQLDVHRIHAATGNGAREYSRRSPPRLSSHVTGPDIRTGSERAIGVCRSSPRCGRPWL